MSQIDFEIEDEEITTPRPVRRSSTSARKSVARSRARSNSTRNARDFNGIHKRGSRRRAR